MAGKMAKRAAKSAAVGLATLGAWYLLAAATTDEEQFPRGYDAVQAAPGSHEVIFENSLVRVLEVTIPPPGKSEPMHHHRWPSLFLDWDTGGKTNHLRYHRSDGSVRDIPSKDNPAEPGHWRVSWKDPEPMHSIETVEQFNSGKDLRVEIKVPD
jgi:hypothetical protein